MFNLSRVAFLLVVGSASAFIAGETSCYGSPAESDNYWYDPDISKEITLVSDIPAVVYYETAATADLYNVKISAKVFAAPGKTGDNSFWFEDETIALDVMIQDAVDDPDNTSGSAISAQGKSVAWIAASVLALFSVYGSRSKMFLTVVFVIALALAAPTAESTDGEVDCNVFGATSRVVIVVTFPKDEDGDSTFKDYKIITDGLAEDSYVESTLDVCACQSYEECSYGVDQKVSCGVSKGSYEDGLVDFRWLDKNCKDQPAETPLPSSNGIVIFAHGWQLFGGREKSNPCWKEEWKATPPGGTEITDWINAGWSVGHVHWERFADELEVKNAEMKIWSSVRRKKMRYRTDNLFIDRFDLCDRCPPVPNMLWPLVKNAIKSHANSGKRVIFAGHSLGSQVISRLANYYSTDPKIATDTEIDLWLLDAFFSEPFLGNFKPGKILRTAVLPVVFRKNARIYRTQTSLANGPFTGDNEMALAKMVMFVEQSTKFFDGLLNGVTATAAKHNVAYVLFFRSIAGFEVGGNPCLEDNGFYAPCALNKMQMHGKCWRQVPRRINEASTVTTVDDRFLRGEEIMEKWEVLRCL